MHYKRTGNPLINEIFTRIEEIGWTLRDLDGEYGTGWYFRGRQRRYRQLSFNALTKAVKALDGEIRITWKQDS